MRVCEDAFGSGATIIVGQVCFTVYTLYYIVRFTQCKMVPHFRHFLPFPNIVSSNSAIYNIENKIYAVS